MNGFWNPWHGCTKVSAGCEHCYMFRRDAEYGRESTIVRRTSDFNLPVRRTWQGDYKLQPDGNPVLTCFTSDFFHPDADVWRPDAWAMMSERSDLSFYFITKRPERFHVGLPFDWGDGYPNVHICCTCEDQIQSDLRLPIFLKLPIRHRSIIHEPMLESINIEPYLQQFRGQIEQVSCGGESGPDVRLCDYEWILNTRGQCLRQGVSFSFHQTGALFRRDGRIYHIDRRYQQSQAKKAGIDLPLL